jgi:hypothetical protein
LIELFVDGKEDGLPDAGRLDVLGLGDGTVLFMLHRHQEGWRWSACSSGVALSDDGLVATNTATEGWQLATGGSTMTEGRHYWEVELTSIDEAACAVQVGAIRPALDYVTYLHYSEQEVPDHPPVYFIEGVLCQHGRRTNWCRDCGGGASHNGLCQHARRLNQCEECGGSLFLECTSCEGGFCGDDQGEWAGRNWEDSDTEVPYVEGVCKFRTGDRIGVLLDLDAGWLKFYHNDKRCGPGWTEGVTGPLVRAVGLRRTGDMVTALPGAVAPEGAAEGALE